MKNILLLLTLSRLLALPLAARPGMPTKAPQQAAAALTQAQFLAHYEGNLKGTG